MHQPIQPQKPNIDSKNHIFSGAERPSVNLYYLICNLHYRTHYIHLFTILKISYWMSGSMEMFLIFTSIKKQVVLILNVVKNYVVFILVSAQFVTVIWWQWHKLTCYIFDRDIWWPEDFVTQTFTDRKIWWPKWIPISTFWSRIVSPWIYRLIVKEVQTWPWYAVQSNRSVININMKIFNQRRTKWLICKKSDYNPLKIFGIKKRMGPVFF